MIMDIKLKINITKLLGILGGIVIIAIHTGCATDDFLPKDNTETVMCGDWESWDSDGDGISNATEINNSNPINGVIPHPQLDPDNVCNIDPSKAIDFCCNGSLQGGLNITNSGEGYTTYQGCDPIDTDDWGTLQLINCIEASGRAFGIPEPIIRKGDMSLQLGGEWGCNATGGGPDCCGHACHQNGLEVDMRYLSKKYFSDPLDISYQSETGYYDTTLTRILMKHIIQCCDVSLIYVDMDYLGFNNDDLPQSVLVHMPGHSDHFHVELVNNY